MGAMGFPGTPIAAMGRSYRNVAFRALRIKMTS
jgi:hypothetical protein